MRLLIGVTAAFGFFLGINSTFADTFHYEYGVNRELNMVISSQKSDSTSAGLYHLLKHAPQSPRTYSGFAIQASSGPIGNRHWYSIQMKGNDYKLNLGSFAHITIEIRGDVAVYLYQALELGLPPVKGLTCKLSRLHGAICRLELEAGRE